MPNKSVKKPSNVPKKKGNPVVKKSPKKPTTKKSPRRLPASGGCGCGL